MKSKGFTLIELMGVIIILALIAIIATPNVIDQIRKLNSEVSKTQMAVFEAAADNYLSLNESQYPVEDGRVYCITLQEIVDAGILSDPIVDAATGETISNTAVLRAKVRNNSFSYDLFEGSGTQCVPR